MLDEINAVALRRKLLLFQGENHRIKFLIQLYNLSDESSRNHRNTCCIMNLFYVCVEFSSACVTFGKFSEQTHNTECVFQNQKGPA